MALVAQESQTYVVNDDNGSPVEITHVFSAVPPSGGTVVRVSVTNNGKENLEVNGTSESTTPINNGAHSMAGPPFGFVANAESTTTREFMVPLMVDFGSRRSYESATLMVNLTISGRNFVGAFRSQSMEEFPFWAVSQSLAGPGADVLNDAAQKKKSGSTTSYGGSEKFAGSFLPAYLPADWRGYAGLDGLALTAEEWNGLLPGGRTALRQWVLLGGVLDLYHNGPVPEGILREIKANQQFTFKETKIQ